jgi:hypothetical protein
VYPYTRQMYNAPARPALVQPLSSPLIPYVWACPHPTPPPTKQNPMSAAPHAPTAAKTPPPPPEINPAPPLSDPSRVSSMSLEAEAAQALTDLQMSVGSIAGLLAGSPSSSPASAPPAAAGAAAAGAGAGTTR